MPQVIAVKIDVTKVDKQRLFLGKNGAKYLDVALLPTSNDKYDNDYVVVQSVSKEERLKGVKGQILGNAKIMGTTTHKAAQKEEPPELDDSSIPF